MRTASILFLFAMVSTANSQVTQEWVQIYDHNAYDYASALVVDTSGNVYVTGGSWNGPTSSYSDYATIKYNASGAEEWIDRYNGQADSVDISYAIAVDDSGNAYVTGQSWGKGSGYDIATVKLNSWGGEQWVVRYNGAANGNDVGSAVAVDDSGNVYVTGYSFNNGTLDYITIKYSAAGVQRWATRYNGTGNGQDWARAIALDRSGNVYVTGYSGGTSNDYATVKYSAAGVQQWVARYNGTGNSIDIARGIAVDGSGNVYVTGASTGSGSSTDYATIKYSASGAQQWVQRYNGPGNGADGAVALAVDRSGNVYVTGDSYGSGTNADYATIQYNASGIQQWLARYNGPANNADAATSLAIDTSGNVYVTGYSYGIGGSADYATIKYSATGGQAWVMRYNGPANGQDQAYSIGLDASGNVYVTGSSAGSGSNYSDVATLRYSNRSSVFPPVAYETWIAGETNTIRWSDMGWPFVHLKCILNFETPQEKRYTIARGLPAGNPEFAWRAPDTLLSFRTKILVENAGDTTQRIESDVFRLKPYVLTRLKNDSTYYAYDKTKDQWGFENRREDVWPSSWWTQFDYQGVDPFTGKLYPQNLGNNEFGSAWSHNHPDWISWVKAFSINGCYFPNTMNYRVPAVQKWRAMRRDVWGGSCFGIAAANALAFGFREQFQLKYPAFPAFSDPVSVLPDTTVIKVVTELFTDQAGNPSIANDRVHYGITLPISTLYDIQQLLKQDNARVQTLTIYNNGPGGGAHTILAYGLSRDSVQKNIYYVKIYDNSLPTSTTPIIIDTAANGGIGAWSSADYAGWGGDRNIYLETTADHYLGGASFPAAPLFRSQSVRGSGILDLYHSASSSIRVLDTQGRITGFDNDTVFNSIPGSFPLILKNGSKTPPYGYELPSAGYSVVMDTFTADTVTADFVEGASSFSYERTGTFPTQTDMLRFDGGVSASNPDGQTKSITLVNSIEGSTEDKLFLLTSIGLAQNDSVRIENRSAFQLTFISYGAARQYDVELNLSGETGFGRFAASHIPMAQNTSHTYVPDWSNVINALLVVLVDVGNDGTIDDTLRLQNQATGIGDDQGSLLTPESYNLSQNYPNPFNPKTIVRYQLPVASAVRLSVYDILGREVAVLVNEVKRPGTYSAEFDGSNCASGIYICRLTAGSFVQTRKLVLVR